jgi:hypothetical protein
MRGVRATLIHWLGYWLVLDAVEITGKFFNVTTTISASAFDTYTHSAFPHPWGNNFRYPLHRWGKIKTCSRHSGVKVNKKFCEEFTNTAFTYTISSTLQKPMRTKPINHIIKESLLWTISAHTNYKYRYMCHITSIFCIVAMSVTLPHYTVLNKSCVFFNGLSALKTTESYIKSCRYWPKPKILHCHHTGIFYGKTSNAYWVITSDTVLIWSFTKIHRLV